MDPLVAPVEKLRPNMLCAVSPKLECPGSALVGPLGMSECPGLSVTGSLGQQDRRLAWGCSSLICTGVSCCILRPESEATELGAGDDVVCQLCQWLTLGGRSGLPNSILGLHWAHTRTYPGGDSHLFPDVAKPCLPR